MNHIYGRRYWLSRDGGWAVVSAPWAGRFRVHFREQTIECMDMARNPGGLVRAFIRKELISLLLTRRADIFVLHANAVTAERKSAVFLGSAGEGKSTLTAFFLAKGSALLSDDVTVIRRDLDRFMIQSGTPELRLRRDSVPILNFGRKIKNERPSRAKKCIPLNGRPWKFCPKSVPVRAIYVLSPKKKSPVRIDLLGPREALLHVLKGVYIYMGKDPGVLQDQFNTVTRLAKSVSVKRLVYPRGFSHLPEVWQSVLQDLSGH